jgi:type II secretory pathway predicted ATPase ExeA
MYEPYFGLSQRPFSAAPRTDRFFPAAAIEAARATLERVLARGEGVGVAIGGVGTGKTLLALRLAEVQKPKARVALLASTRLTRRRALLQAVLHALARPYRGMDETELRLALGDALTAGGAEARPVALIVDDAHALRASVLDEIRTLLDHVASGEPLVRAVLIGAPLLEEHLASPKVEALAQRIAARTYLQAFTSAETAEYVRLQIQSCGGAVERLFASDAIEALYKATDGLPRIVNQLADHALLLAMAAARRVVDAAVVEEAWADLQQLPMPWNAHAVTGTVRHNVVEFGELVETDAEPVASIPFRSTPNAAAAGSSAAASGASLEGDVFEWNGVANESLPDDDSDDEFCPAGSFTTEVEVAFDYRENPFGESFAAEEVVDDRTAAIESEWAKNRPAAMPQVIADAAALVALGGSAGGAVAAPDVPVSGPAIPPPAVESKEPRPRRREFRHLFADLRRAQ